MTSFEKSESIDRNLSKFNDDPLAREKGGRGEAARNLQSDPFGSFQSIEEFEGKPLA